MTGAGAAVAAVAAVAAAGCAVTSGGGPLGLAELDLRLMKRLLMSSVEKAAPVLRTGDECLDDSADVLLSELADERAALKRSVTRFVRLETAEPASSAAWLSELLDGVRLATGVLCDDACDVRRLALDSSPDRCAAVPLVASLCLPGARLALLALTAQVGRLVPLGIVRLESRRTGARLGCFPWFVRCGRRLPRHGWRGSRSLARCRRRRVAVIRARLAQRRRWRRTGVGRSGR